MAVGDKKSVLMADGSVPMTGDLKIDKTSIPEVRMHTVNGFGFVTKNATSNVDNGTQLVDVDAKGNRVLFSVRGSQYASPLVMAKLVVTGADGTSANYNIYHSGNLEALRDALKAIWDK